MTDAGSVLPENQPQNAVAIRGAGRVGSHSAGGNLLAGSVAEGDGGAARYTLTAVMRRGQVIANEIHMFGRLTADGRLRTIEQLTRDVSSSAA